MTPRQERRAHRLKVGDGILEALEARADRARRAGRFDEARRWLERLLAFDAHRTSARRLEGRISMDRGAFMEAFETFRSICDDDPRDTQSAALAGEALYYAGSPRGARRWLEYAIEQGEDVDPRAGRRARILLQKVRVRRRRR